MLSAPSAIPPSRRRRLPPFRGEHSHFRKGKSLLAKALHPCLDRSKIGVDRENARGNMTLVSVRPPPVAQCCDFGIGPTLDHAVQGRSNVAQRGPRSPILWRARVVQGQFWKGWTWSKVGSSVA